jgi:hypothetical protein
MRNEKLEEQLKKMPRVVFGYSKRNVAMKIHPMNG